MPLVDDVVPSRQLLCAACGWDMAAPALWAVIGGQLGHLIEAHDEVEAVVLVGEEVRGWEAYICAGEEGDQEEKEEEQSREKMVGDHDGISFTMSKVGSLA